MHKDRDCMHTISDLAKSLVEHDHITVKYPAKLKCDQAELVTEFNSPWPVVSKTWLKYKDAKPSSTRMILEVEK